MEVYEGLLEENGEWREYGENLQNKRYFEKTRENFRKNGEKLEKKLIEKEIKLALITLN